MYVDICTVIEHRGQLLKRKLKEAHISAIKFAREFGWKDKSSLYRNFSNPEVPLDVFVFAVRKYGILFSDRELPELNPEVMANLGDLVPGKNIVSIHDHNAIVVDLQRKYIAERDQKETLAAEKSELEIKLLAAEKEIKTLKNKQVKVKYPFSQKSATRKKRSHPNPRQDN